MSRKQPTQAKSLSKPAKKTEPVDPAVAKVNWQWREFILGIMNGKPKYQAYAEAYGIENVDTDKKRYQVAAANASETLKNPKFQKYWQEVLEEQGFTNREVDSVLIGLITDPATPHQARVNAIKHFNELQGRIVKKVAPTDDKGNSLFDDDSTEFSIKVVKRGNGNKRAAANSAGTTKRPASN